MRLGYPECMCHLCLSQSALGDEIVDAHGELDPKLVLPGIGKAEIDEYIAGSCSDSVTLSCHSAPRSPRPRSAGGVLPARRRWLRCGCRKETSSESNAARTPLFRSAPCTTPATYSHADSRSVRALRCLRPSTPSPKAACALLAQRLTHIRRHAPHRPETPASPFSTTPP